MKFALNRWIVTLTFICASTVYAQRPDLTFDHYNVEDGLSQSTVWNIFEDSKGFMWFCTPDGLNKFDGYSFTIYRNIKGNKNSIVSSHPVFIFEDSDGDLWINHKAGLSKYNYRHDTFSEVARLTEFTSEDEGILPLYENDGKIWAWDCNRGFIGFNRTTLKEEAVYELPESLKRIHAYARFGKAIGSRIFIATHRYGMIVFDFKTRQYTVLFNKKFDPNFNINYLSTKFGVDGDSNLWIAGRGGLMHLNSKTLKSDFVFYPEFKDINLTSCAIDKNGMLWIGSSTRGLYLLDLKSKSCTNILKNNSKTNGLLYNYVESLLADSSGNIWIGTNGYGFQKFSPFKNKFDYYDLNVGTESFGGNLVKSIFEQRGNLYVGTYGNGLYEIKKSGEIKNYTVPGVSNAIALASGDNDELIVSNSANLFLLKRGSIVPLKFSGIAPIGVTSALNNGKDVLLATPGGIFSLKKNPDQYHIESKFPLAHVSTVIFKDSKQRLWFGTQQSFYVLSATDTTPKDMSHITKNFVKSFYEDESGNIWIATLGELICYNPETKKEEHFNETHGFANTFFYAALPGSDHKIWVSSNQGLASLDPISKKVKNYTVLDGLQSNEFNTGAFCKMNDGRLAFGGLNGLNVFDPLQIKENPNPPRIVFTKFNVDDKSYPLDTAIVYKKKIDLSYDNNTVSFEFAGLEYTSPANHQYAYRLVGLDKDWVQAGARRFVRYSRLQPGSYEFKVKASNSDGVWNEKPSTIIISILPPFYLQVWFVASAIALTVMLIVLISISVVRSRYRARLRRLEVDHKIQNERERISRDLHDHVGSQLTFIINQLDGKEEHVQKRQLNDTLTAARQTMQNLRETIWALHHEAVTLVDFTDRVKEFAMRQTKAKMSLNFDEKLSTEYTLNPTTALNLFRITQEAINNATKHSEGNRLTISVEQTEGAFSVSISDNGKGLRTDKKNGDNFGLANMKFRAKEIGATLDVTSDPKTGTNVTIDLKFTTQLK